MPKDRREVFLLAAFLKKSHCCQIWKQKLVKVKMVIMNKVKGRMFSAHYQSHVFLHSQPWMCACCVDRCGSVGTLVCMTACFYSLFMHHLQIIFEGDLKGPCSISKGLKCPKKKSWLKAKPVKSWLNIFFPGSIQLNLSIPCELCLLLYFVSFPDLSRLPFFFFLVKSFYSEISALQKKGGPGDNRYDVQICLFHKCSFSPPVALLGS